MKAITAFLAAAALSVFGITSTSTPAVIQNKCVDITRNLSIGSKGGDVAKLQTFLDVEETAYFGKKTEQQLIKWQLSKKIIASARTAGAGTTGPKTRAALRCPTFKSQPSTAAPSSSAASFKATTATPSASTTQEPATLAPSAGSGGSGGGSISPYGYVCGEVGAKPSASSCPTGPWQIILDEAGCGVWACMDWDERG